MLSLEEISLKILKIIKNNIDLKVNYDEIEFDDDLIQMGVNSLNYIKLIVYIEKEFEIEFDDENLAIKKYDSIKSLTDYVQENINVKHR
ncbi:phosphopantetheine-binding protein [Clostridium estertheticum]|uniref:phosphopantetheine-binding protein n=1 Tax=Clostridium estertheticum TaxID=238834 RepID=UPI001C0BA515|nr:phosphopantetheine-binding protein [Clostridium estertheticum]MBU3198523.1 acyl carrier protein [Clostridium estertheticum]WAG64504.1 phosphopantetheine-binding protein [Clostridium estertheticum]